ncbi:hypothetical protein JYT72_00955 [Crocinitomix catalasitica]|nr:hypothetical protein [Crocinitomix catalasitica]
MAKIVCTVLLATLLACQGQNQTTDQSNIKSENADLESGNNYSTTELPIRIELMSEEDKQVISDGYKTDTSSYLIYSRPLIFQIQGIKNNQNQIRHSNRINEEIEVLIYCLGEAIDSTLVDYGWIQNERGETVWKMTFENSEYAGGDNRNRKSVIETKLPPGTYSLNYTSNESHAVDDWIGDKPEHEYYYGITVFNTKAIESIKKKLK